MVALVTGASRGIGAACAVALARAGHDVVVNYATDQDGATAVAEAVAAIGGRAIAMRADVSDEAEAAGLVERAEAELGHLDVLVANAGITRDAPAIRLDAAAWQAVIGTNLSGAFFTIRPALRGMLRRRAGAVVAMSSVVGQIGNPGQAAYAAAKAGLVGLVRALAVECAPRGVRVNAVAPGFIATDMTAALPQAHREALLGLTPLGRLGDPEDVAAAVAFLCSPSASFITGAVLPVDGGILSR